MRPGLRLTAVRKWRRSDQFVVADVCAMDGNCSVSPLHPRQLSSVPVDHRQTLSANMCWRWGSLSAPLPVTDLTATQIPSFVTGSAVAFVCAELIPCRPLTSRQDELWQLVSRVANQLVVDHGGSLPVFLPTLVSVDGFHVWPEWLPWC